MICAYLLYTGAWKTAHGAMEFFAAARSLKREGVTIPSQRRFISYFGEMCYPQGVEGEYEQREIELTTDEYHQIWQEEISDQTDVIKRRLLHWDPDAFVIPVLPASVYLVITSIKLNGIYANKRFGKFFFLSPYERGWFMSWVVLNSYRPTYSYRMR
jgi:hypothetical protein